MFSSSFAYTWILIASALGPLACSFLPQIRFYRLWIKAIASGALVACIFIPWDVWFTRAGVWGFTPAYTQGIYFWDLPVEEILFFIVIPFACLFVYECCAAFPFLARVSFPRIKKRGFYLLLCAVLGCLVLATSIERMYTSSVLMGTSAAFFLLSIPAVYRYIDGGRFFLAYGIALVPFFIVNGILTSLPVVWYNDAENCGLRMVTIPVEDLGYQFILFMMNAAVFNCIKTHKFFR